MVLFPEPPSEKITALKGYCQKNYKYGKQNLLANTVAYILCNQWLPFTGYYQALLKKIPHKMKQLDATRHRL